ncbi:MAG: MFS transporter [Verrucomicrobiae bacterium]|nr:MFS transporter [Verrucomicrobiae bacterium]
MRSNFGEVLRNRNFFRLWWGQIISSIGDRFYQFAILYVVLQLTPEQGMGVGKESARVLFCGMVLTVVLAPWIGRAVDRWDRKWVMIGADLSRVVLVLIMLGAWVAWKSPALMLVFVALTGLMNGVFIPARQAAVPLLVEGRQLVTANALITVVGVVGSLVGSGVGFVVAIFGEKSSFIITALGFLASAILVGRIEGQLKPMQAENRAVSWSEIGNTFLEVLRDKVVRQIFLVNGGIQFVSGLFAVFVLEYVVQSLDMAHLRVVLHYFSEGVMALGFREPVMEEHLVAVIFLLLSAGVGLILGIGLSGRFVRVGHYEGLPMLMFGMLGMVFYGLSFSHSLEWVMGLCVLVGLASALLIVPMDARLQFHVPSGRHGEFFAVRSAWGCSCFLVALALNLDGRLLGWRGADQMIRDLGVFCVALAGIMSLMDRGSFRKFWGDS